MTEPVSQPMARPVADPVPERAGGRRLAWRVRRLRARGFPALRPRALEIGWLTVVWVLLWGTFTPLSIVGGVVVAIGVLAAFRFPAPAPFLPVRPRQLLALACYLAYDVVVSGAEVSWQAVRYGRGARGAVVEVPLLSSSDRVVVVIANALSLSPGAMALQIDQERGRWFVYALGPRDAAGVERSRRRTMDMQRRVIAALGTPEELAAAEAAAAEVAAARTGG